MEKRIMLRITFESLTLAQTAELEEKIEEVLEEYGEHRLEITAIPTPLRPRRGAL